MAENTVTFALHGEVSLAVFADAVTRFQELVAALAAEAHAKDVEWKIDGLEYSSAITTARGMPTNGTTEETVASIVHSYLEVGEALQKGITIPFPKPVQTPARALAALIDGTRVTSVRFETAQGDAIVQEPVGVPIGQLVATLAKPMYGAVTGRVQTLTSRNQLRFTVYDHIYDRAVSCYLIEGQEAMMRQMWDRLAIVEGMVTRDPQTGRPLSVRKITNVTPVPEVEPQAYQHAMGVLPYGDGDPLPEDVIRRLRDAG